MRVNSADNLHIFISYAHEKGGSDMEKLDNLHDLLLKEGFTVGYYRKTSGVNDLQKWMRGQCKRSNFILVACNKKYMQRSKKRKSGVKRELEHIKKLVHPRSRFPQLVKTLLISGEREKSVPKELENIDGFNFTDTDFTDSTHGALKKLLK